MCAWRETISGCVCDLQTSDSSSEVAASLQGMQDQMQSLSAKLHRVERSKELAEQELAAVKGEVVSLRELEAEASSKCLHLQSELDLVQRELRLVQGQVPEETQHELRQQLSEVTHLQSEVAAAEKRQQQEQEKVASLESVIRDLREENQRLTERLDLLAQQELAATDRVKLLQAELEQQSSTMSRSDAEIVSLQESLQILQVLHSHPTGFILLAHTHHRTTMIFVLLHDCIYYVALHTHTHISINIYIFVCVCIFVLFWSGVWTNA